MTGSSVPLALAALTLGLQLIIDASDAPKPLPAALDGPDQAPRTRQPLPGARLPEAIFAEVVADAPLVTLPMGLEFDSKGGLWVLEQVEETPRKPKMAADEARFTARIVRLADTDGDGRLDSRTIRADGLALPASILAAPSGIYLGQPRGIVWLQHSDGDLRPGTRTEIFSVGPETHGKPKSGPGDGELLGDCLFASLDNWIYSPRLGVRFRPLPGQLGRWTHETFVDPDASTVGSDESGRLIHAVPGRGFHVEPIPFRFLRRNPNHAPEFPDLLRRAEGSEASNSTAARSDGPSPGGTSGPSDLAVGGIRATGAVIYRGELLPATYRGDLFVCDPGRGMILRHGPPTTEERADATRDGTNEVFLEVEGGNFTPVQLKNGPDGALYVADLGRGPSLGLESSPRPAGERLQRRPSASDRPTGRILRIANRSASFGVRQRSPQATRLWEIATRFTGSNGFWQDSAQQALVENPSPESTKMLVQWVRDHQRLVGDVESTPASVRLRALWTLEGQGRLSAEVLRIALEDPDPVVRSTALQIVADQAPGPLRDEAMSWVLRRSAAFPTKTQASLLVCLGTAATPQADGLMRSILLGSQRSVLQEDAAISGLSRRELGFVSQLAADPRCGASPVRHVRLVRRLGECLRKAGNPEEIRKALDLACGMPETDWRVSALIEGLANPELAHRERGILRHDDPMIRERIRLLESRRLWPPPR